MTRTLSIFLIAVVAIGCQTVHQVPREEAVERYAEELSSPPGLVVEGYVSPDGTEHGLRSHVRLVGNAFEFNPAHRNSLDAESPIRVPRSGVEALQVSRFDPGKTAGATFGMAAAVVALAGVSLLCAMIGVG